MSSLFVLTAVIVVVSSNRWRSRFVHVRGPWSTWTTITGNNRQAAVIAQTLVCAHTSQNKRAYLYYCNRHPRQNVPGGSKLRWRGKAGSPLCSALHRLRYHYNFRYHYHHHRHHHHNIITPSGGGGGRLITGTICLPNICRRGWLHSRTAFRSIQTIDDKDD